MYKYKDNEGDIHIKDSPTAIFYLAFGVISLIVIPCWLLGYIEWWGILVGYTIHIIAAQFHKKTFTILDQLSNTLTIRSGNLFFHTEEEIKVRDIEKFYIIAGEGVILGELGALAVRANGEDYIIVEADLQLNHYNKLRTLRETLKKEVEYLNRF